MTIAEQQQAFNPGNRIELFELDASKWGQGILRFTAAGFDEDVSGLKLLSFGGNEYSALPVEADGFEWNGKGAQPRPTLTLSTISDVVRSLLIETDGLVGAQLTRQITFDRFLDGHEEPDGTQVICHDIFNVELMESMNKVFCKLKLSTILDIEGVKFPSGQMIRNTCIHAYRYWDGSQFVYPSGRACPYTGEASFDISNSSTSSDNDLCSKTLVGCRVRFGENGKLPFLGFPGLFRL